MTFICHAMCSSGMRTAARALAQHLPPHQHLRSYRYSAWTYHLYIEVHLCQRKCGLCYQMPRTSQDLYRRKLVDAWVTDLGNIYAPKGYQTLPVGRHFAFQGHTTHVILVSVIRSTFRDATVRRSFEARMIFRHCTLHPGGFNVNPACVDFIKKKKVSVRLKRCEFCPVTLHA